MFTGTGTAPDFPNQAVSLCHETGALCEAFKLGRGVTGSVCVTAADEDRGYWILAPCGVCQERLFAHGPDVEVAVPECRTRVRVTPHSLTSQEKPWRSPPPTRPGASAPLLEPASRKHDVMRA